MARKAWENQPNQNGSLVEHVRNMRERIDRVMPLVREHLVTAQRTQQRLYNRPAQAREFQQGDRVMVFVPTAASKFLAIWQGPYTIVEQVGLVTYRVRQPGRRRVEQIYHINLLKKWMAQPEELAAFTQSQPLVVDVDPQLSRSQKTELQHLVSHFSDVFSKTPGRTTVLHHEIRTPPGVVVRQQAYQIPEDRRLAIEEEMKKR